MASTMKKIELQTLNQNQIREIVRLKNAYYDELHLLQNTRGFSFMEHDEALHLLEEAAELVVRIRSHLQTVSRGFLSLTGRASEYLSNVDKMPPEDEFVRGLVCASLEGCGFSMEVMNSWIDQIFEFRNCHENDKMRVEGSVLEDEVMKKWKETQLELKETIAKDEEKYWNASLVSSMEQLLNHVTRMQKLIRLLKKKREFMSRRREAAKPAAPPESTEESKPTPEETVDLKKGHGPEPTEQKTEETQNAEVPMSQNATLPESQKSVPATTEEHGPSDQAGLITIKTVCVDVSKIEAQLQDLDRDARKIRSNKTALPPSEALGLINKLEKQCSSYANQLMGDLLKLDELAGLEEIKSLKKQETNQIQQLLQDVDRLKEELGKFHLEIKPLVEQELEKIAEEELEHLEREIKKQESQAKVENAPVEKTSAEPLATEITKIAEDEFNHMMSELKRASELKIDEKALKKVAESSENPEKVENPETESPESTVVKSPEAPEMKSEESIKEYQAPPLAIDLTAAWENIRLNPRIEVDEDSKYYVIFATLPGITEDKLEVSLSPESATLVIGGTRVPTDEELSQMRKIIRQRHAPKDQYEEDVYVLRYGVGRFGRFSRTYSLPTGVDMANIKGTFKDGMLTIVIPKGSRIRQIPVLRTPAAAPSLPFFGDSNVWW